MSNFSRKAKDSFINIYFFIGSPMLGFTNFVAYLTYPIQGIINCLWISLANDDNGENGLFAKGKRISKQSILRSSVYILIRSSYMRLF